MNENACYAYLVKAERTAHLAVAAADNAWDLVRECADLEAWSAFDAAYWLCRAAAEASRNAAEGDTMHYAEMADLKADDLVTFAEAHGHTITR